MCSLECILYRAHALNTREKGDGGEGGGQTQPSRQRGQQQSPNTSTVIENTFYRENRFYRAQ